MATTAKQISFTEKERKVLTSVLVNSVTTKSRKERRTYENIFIELELDGFEAEMLTKGGIPILAEDDNVQKVFEVSREVLEYLLEKLDADQNGPSSRIIFRIEEKLLAVKEERYSLPGV